MNEDFVTYELAKKLKEKGFDIPFYFYYRTDDKLIHHAMVTKPLVYHDKIDDEVVCAPAISQVLKWLREQKKIHIQILFTCPPNRWEYITVKMTNNELRGMCTTFTSYEQAALAGIEYVLYNLI